MSAWPKALILLVTGYLTMTRSFAYLGIPPLRLFIGEVAIALFLITRPGELFNRWFGALSEPTPLGEFAVALVCFLAYGWFELIRGFAKGYPTLIAMQGFAFHYYPICFFIGMWAASRNVDLLRRTIYIVAWANGVYGILYLVILNRFPLAMPGTVDVAIFGQPAGSAIALLGLLCVESRLSKIWPVLLLNLLVMLGLQVRAEFLGFLLGALLWGFLTRRADRLVGGLAVVIVLLAVAFAADVSAPAPATRGGRISAREVVGRVVAPFDPDLAAEWDPDAKSHAGTAEWRVRWWSRIWDEVHGSTETAFIGEGYGYPLADLVGYKERDIRTPHSVLFYALGYGGWIGVALFALLQLTLARTLWASWKVSQNAFGPVLWLTFLSGACFGNAFETPFGAVPFYLLAGMAAAAAPVKAPEPRYANLTRAYILQTAGR